VHQLVEAMLPICSRLPKDDRASLHSVVQACPIDAATLTIALHVKLLDMSWESEQCLTVRKDSSRLNTADVGVIEAN